MAPNVRLILVDLYGHGESSWSHTPAEEDIENAQHILLLLRHLKVHSYFVGGHSFGGRVGGLIAATEEEPSKVLGAFFITPVPIKGIVPEKNLLLSIMGGETTAVGVTKVGTAAINSGVPVRLDFGEEYLRAFTRTSKGEESHIETRIRVLDRDRSSIIPSIRAPILFLSGDRDFFFPQTFEELSLFKHTTPNFHSLFGEGHLLTITATVEVATVINKFIQKHAPK